MKLSISKNAHPNTDGSPWGWIVIDGTRIRVATWSGYDEQKRCDEVITTVNNHASLKQQLSDLQVENERLKELVSCIALVNYWKMLGFHMKMMIRIY